jgi:hypothetical protein
LSFAIGANGVARVARLIGVVRFVEVEPMQNAHSDLRARLAKAIEALILPRNHTAAIGEAAQQVVMALIQAREIDATAAASDRRLALDILTPRNNDDYQSHAAKLKETERQQAGLTLFHLYEAIGAESKSVSLRAVSSRRR